MDSIPSANRSSVRGEKTGNSSRSGSARNAAAHNGLSRSASTAIVSQSVAVLAGKELLRRLGGALDLARAVCRGQEHGLELRRGHVHPAFEKMPEESAVALEVALLGLREIAYRAVAEEASEHRAHPLHGDVAVPKAGPELG